MIGAAPVVVATPLFRGSDYVAFAAIAFAAFSLWFTTWVATRRERRSEHSARLDAASATLAGVLALLTDADPERWALNAGPRAREIVESWTARWPDVRIGLLKLVVTLPSPQGRDLARRVEVAVNNCLVSSGQFGMALPGQGPWTREQAEHDHQEALALADELATSLHGL